MPHSPTNHRDAYVCHGGGVSLNPPPFSSAVPRVKEIVQHKLDNSVGHSNFGASFFSCLMAKLDLSFFLHIFVDSYRDMYWGLIPYGGFFLIGYLNSINSVARD